MSVPGIFRNAPDSTAPRCVTSDGSSRAPADAPEVKADTITEALRVRLELYAGPSEWIVVEQSRIDAFAQCTGDTYWLHTDPARARREGPFDDTIAHGFLLLSLIAGHGAIHLDPIPGVAHVLNYGLERVRFLTPVLAGARVRIHTRVEELVEKDPGRWLLRQEKRIEIEGEARPALVATHLAMFLPG